MSLHYAPAVHTRLLGSARRHATRMLLAIGSVLALSFPNSALAQTTAVCGPEVKAEAARALAAVEGASDDQKAAAHAQVYERYRRCTQDASATPDTFYIAARQCGASVSQLGSTFFEEMSCAGYDPQRRQFAAPVKIKQPFGFGGAPLPGSREYVLHCVADAAGVLRPVGRDSVHLADAANQQPTWQFAVIVNASENLQTIYPMSGQTRRARSILSWGLPPTGCDYQPIWGNALNYRIRLDQ